MDHLQIQVTFFFLLPAFYNVANLPQKYPVSAYKT